MALGENGRCRMQVKVELITVPDAVFEPAMNDANYYLQATAWRLLALVRFDKLADERYRKH